MSASDAAGLPETSVKMVTGQWSSHLRVIGLYLAMVGLPVLGVLGLLQFGKGLKPPVAVRGTWNVEVGPQASDGSACSASLGWPDRTTLTIAQSGPELHLTFSDSAQTTLIGEIDELTLTAAVPPVKPQAHLATSPATGIQFRATVDRQAEPDRLVGVLTSNTCNSPVPVTATRLLDPQAMGDQ